MRRRQRCSVAYVLLTGERALTESLLACPRLVEEDIGKLQLTRIVIDPVGADILISIAFKLVSVDLATFEVRPESIWRGLGTSILKARPFGNHSGYNKIGKPS